MDLTPVMPIVAMAAFASIRLAKIKAAHLPSMPGEASARIDALEQDVQGLQQQLAETQERLDFAERLLSSGRDERGSGS
jgi:hypothetical protein